MSFAEAFVGAKAELASIRSPIEKIARVARLGKIVADELLGTISMIPYGYRTLRLYNGLPDGRSERTDAHKVHVLRNVIYGDRERNNMDVYLPPSVRPGSPTGYPVALFVHGGVWASGEKWHYAPMASRLAQAGVLAVVMQYTLYPKALVPELISEVSEALTWTLDNVEELGGDARKVSVIGHSAGAHLCSMALLQRASRSLPPSLSPPALSAPPQPDRRMPHQALLINGVYDISRHFEYERARGVHEMSTMKRAMGGPSKFDEMSPLVILGQALGGGAHRRGRLPWDAEVDLAGEAIARYIGFGRGGGDSNRRDAEAASSSHSRGRGRSSESSCAAATTSGKSSGTGPAISLEDARKLPHTVLLSSCTDVTVPWYESAEMYWQLHDCGVPAQHLVYNKVGHAEFVTNWPHHAPGAAVNESVEEVNGLTGTVDGSDLQGLPPYARDITRLVSRLGNVS